MIVNFHTDPIDLDAICLDLDRDGVVVIDTTRTNFSAISSAVMQRMPDRVLSLSAEDSDHDWHHYLINTTVESFEATASGQRVIEAVAKWKAVGSPIPYSIRV
jgi:hypothetical protein